MTCTPSASCGLHPQASRPALTPPRPAPRPPAPADSFWRAVLHSAPKHEVLVLQHPPTAYYWSHCEDLPKKQAPLRLAHRGKQQLLLPQGEEEAGGWGEGGADENGPRQQAVAAA